MASKKEQPIDPKASNEVDMDYIKEMMGPLPFEVTSTADQADAKIIKEDDKKIAASTSKSLVTAAAEEANATLKAMSADMGKATITKVEDEPSGEDLMSSEMLDDLNSLGAVGGEEQDSLDDDAVTVSAVDDIVLHEGDTVLEVEDEKLAETKATSKKLQKDSLVDKLKNVWAKKYVRLSVISVVLLSLIVVAITPTSRYFVLNNVGVRSSASLSVVESSTQQPLKNVTVTVAGADFVTDSKGFVKLEHLKLGPTEIIINKRAFTKISQQITVGWGSNPLGQLRLTPSGSRFTFNISDFLSDKPIEKVEATSGDGNAVSDVNGKLVLVLDTSGRNDNEEISVQLTSDRYRTETVKVKVDSKIATKTKMVPSRKSAFVSKRTGKYDIYTIDVDGKNEQKIVNGTGVERSDIALALQQRGDVAAYVATRENVRNRDGYLLSTLYFLDTKTGNLTKVDQSERIRLIGWSSDQRLVYAKTMAGASAANAKRERLMSVDTKDSSDKKELASSNSFNDVLMAGDKVLYAPSNSYGENPKPGLFMVNPNGQGSLEITNKEAYNIFRNNYDSIVFDSGGSYYGYKIGAAANTVAATVSTDQNRLYVDNSATSSSLWLDDRDGKTVMLNYDKTTKKDTAIVSKSGIKQPIYWLNDTTVIYRLNDGSETADYAISINGGTAKKIQDVTDTTGISRWYYY